MPPNRTALCFVVSSPATATAFLLPHIAKLEAEYDVTVIANCPRSLDLSTLPCKVVHVPIYRDIRPLKDLWAWIRLATVIRQGRCSLVISVTPKAGFLTALTTLTNRYSPTVHWFTGQVWATRRGLMRLMLKSIDRFTAMRAKAVLVDSPSQREFLIQEGLVPSDAALVLGPGSIAGVDTERFRPNSSQRRMVRHHLGIPDDAFVVVFVGRSNSEKGVPELLEALQLLRSTQPIHILFIGGDEDGQLEQSNAVRLKREGRLHDLGHVSDPEHFIVAADVMCLPSHREGFGMAVIEAAACGLPSVGTRIYGLTDAIVEDVTGILVSVSSPSEIAEGLQTLTDDPLLATRMGEEARVRVESEFRQEILTDALRDLIRTLITKHNE